MDRVIKHIGIKRRSGRYPYGSGKDPYQRNETFLSYVKELRDKGLTQTQIAEAMGMSTTELRQRNSIAKEEQKAALRAQAYRLKEKGYSNVAIGERMHLNESSVRDLLKPAMKDKESVTKTVSRMLEEAVEKHGYIDVGSGVEAHIGVSSTKLKTALYALEAKGYQIHYIYTKQLGTGKQTTIKVLAKPDIEYKEIVKNKDKIGYLSDYSPDGGRTVQGLLPVQSVKRSRVYVRYGEEGGSQKDGVIELRRGAKDVDLGASSYAQVRIGVEGNLFMKGMAMYGSDIPKGYDIVYNTNKPKGSADSKVFKPMKVKKDGDVDQDNPFGATIKRNGQRGALNIVYEEGDWDRWKKTISSQMLSKQPVAVAKKQLDLALKGKKEEFDEIMSLTNPAVKAKLLKSFSDDLDASAVHLKAAAFPGQAAHVLLPLTKINPKEIYAPGYPNGTPVVLVRFPHGGVFEIPQLTVNNKVKDGIDLIGPNSKDAVGIHPTVTAKLSGADFDGDTVLVIPNRSGTIKTAPSLKEFDPKAAYPEYPGMKVISPRNKQKQMGVVSNLITDMTIKGASLTEIEAAVRHSMVVIDAEKHRLNYKQSEIDNGIAALKKKYQGAEKAGAATLISRASSTVRVNQRSDNYKIGPDGRKIYTETGRQYQYYKVKDKSTGKIVTVYPKKGDPIPPGVKVHTEYTKQKSTRMGEERDARRLSSGTKMEEVYADYANAVKALANESRRAMVNTPPVKYNPSAARTYADQVTSLKASLNLAIRNRPLERRAQLVADAIVRAKVKELPDMDEDGLKRLKGQALTEARFRTGAHKDVIKISDIEWEAIQMGAISNNVLKQIMENADLDLLKQKALPRTAYKMTDAKVSKAKAMAGAGYTNAEIAEALGVSITTVKDTLA